MFSDFEMQKIQTLFVDDRNFIVSQSITFKSAFTSFLLEASMMQYKKLAELWMPEDYLTRPILQDQLVPHSSSTPAQKAAFYLFANGLRTIRKATDEAQDFFHKIIVTYNVNHVYLTIMLISVFISFASICFVFFQIFQIEHIQREIFSLYAYLSKDHIKETLTKAHDFMVEILQGSFLAQIMPKGTQIDEIGLFQSIRGRMDPPGTQVKSSFASERLMDRQSIYTYMIRRASQ